MSHIQVFKSSYAFNLNHLNYNVLSINHLNYNVLSINHLNYNVLS